MAYGIRDKKIVEATKNPIGIKLISSFIKEKENHDNIIQITLDGTILIQTKCFKGPTTKRYDKFLSNSVIINNDSISINPVMDKNRKDFTMELYNYIYTLPTLILQEERDKKISKIFG